MSYQWIIIKHRRHHHQHHVTTAVAIRITQLPLFDCCAFVRRLAHVNFDPSASAPLTNLCRRPQPGYKWPEVDAPHARRPQCNGKQRDKTASPQHLGNAVVPLSQVGQLINGWNHAAPVCLSDCVRVMLVRLLVSLSLVFVEILTRPLRVSSQSWAHRAPLSRPPVAAVCLSLSSSDVSCDMSRDDLAIHRAALFSLTASSWPPTCFAFCNLPLR